MPHVTTIIIGAGQCGLAFSAELSKRSIDHVILERGEIGNSWKTERWDSLRLLTPNWQTRLPGFAYRGSDPDSYMSASQVGEFLDQYSIASNAPVQTQTNVTSVSAVNGGYLVETDRGNWTCNSLVIASGACNQATIPSIASDLPQSVESISTLDYKSPDQLTDGAVMVVGASASGAQLAKEIQATGKQVYLSVGEHVRMPRTYRGRDICWWMDQVGLMDDDFRQVEDLNRARKLASLQLMGSDDQSNINLNSLQSQGIKVCGRLQMIREQTALFSGGLANHCMLADLKMNRLLESIDGWITDNGLDHEHEPVERLEETKIPAESPLMLDIEKANINTVIWATGYKPDYSWLNLPVFDRKGAVRHQGGIVEGVSGVYLMGLPFMRRRKSSYIDGAGADAADLAQHLAASLLPKAA